MHCVLPGEKTPNTTFAAPVRLRLVSKNHKKLIEFFHKSVILTVAAKMGEKAFFLNLKIIFCIFLLVRIGLIGLRVFMKYWQITVKENESFVAWKVLSSWSAGSRLQLSFNLLLAESFCPIIWSLTGDSKYCPKYSP